MPGEDRQRAQVSGYVDEREKRTFTAHAMANGYSSRSEWIAEACREKVKREYVASERQRLEIDQQILAVLDQVPDRVAADLQDELAPAIAQELIRQLAAAEAIEPSRAGLPDGEQPDDSRTPGLGDENAIDPSQFDTEDQP